MLKDFLSGGDFNMSEYGIVPEDVMGLDDAACMDAYFTLLHLNEPFESPLSKEEAMYYVDCMEGRKLYSVAVRDGIICDVGGDRGAGAHLEGRERGASGE